jgi:dihydropteroate synthase
VPLPGRAGSAFTLTLGARDESRGASVPRVSTERPYALMGVVNVTPDSFSDGGAFDDAVDAVAHARRLIAEGAGIVDVGGESTRPGADPVPASEELDRVLPVVDGIAGLRLPVQISIDTMKAAVAEAALDAGATYVNDVTAFRHDPDLAGLVADRGVDCCLMHMLGEPRTMQLDPRYEDVVSEVKAFLEERMAATIAAGVPEERIQLDPGIGFGKTVAHNLELLRRLDELVAIGRPLVIGTSRKTFLGKLTGRDVTERVHGTTATCVLALERGARVFRVHDVAAVADALTVAAATLASPWPATIPRTTRTS